MNKKAAIIATAVALFLMACIGCSVGAYWALSPEPEPPALAQVTPTPDVSAETPAPTAETVVPTVVPLSTVALPTATMTPVPPTATPTNTPAPTSTPIPTAVPSSTPTSAPSPTSASVPTVAPSKVMSDTGFLNSPEPTTASRIPRKLIGLLLVAAAMVFLALGLVLVFIFWGTLFPAKAPAKSLPVAMPVTPPQFVSQAPTPFTPPAPKPTTARTITTIGREVDNDVVVDDPRVSKYHAKITQSGDQGLIEDLVSTNGTFVNGKRIFEPMLIQVNDLISFGDVTFFFTGFDPDGNALLVKMSVEPVEPEPPASAPDWLAKLRAQAGAMPAPIAPKPVAPALAAPPASTVSWYCYGCKVKVETAPDAVKCPSGHWRRGYKPQAARVEPEAPSAPMPVAD